MRRLMDIQRPRKRRPWLAWLHAHGAVAGLVIVMIALGVAITTNVLPRSQVPVRAAARMLTQFQTREIDKLEAEHPQSFSEITGVRELRDGRILVLDRLERSVQVLDFGKESSEQLGKAGKG